MGKIRDTADRDILILYKDKCIFGIDWRVIDGKVEGRRSGGWGRSGEWEMCAIWFVDKYGKYVRCR